MPKLLALIPCDRVIINQGDEIASLISIIENVNIGVPAEDEIPANAVAPVQWNLFTLWKILPEEEGKMYVQRTYLKLPDGQELLDAELEFRASARIVRNIVKINGLPVSQPGEILVNLFLREQDKDDQWTKIEEYPLTVIYSK